MNYDAARKGDPRLTGWTSAGIAWVILTYLLGAAHPAEAQDAFDLPPAVLLEEGIPYSERAGSKLALDLFTPAEPGPDMPSLVFLCRGGFRAGENAGKRRFLWPLAARMASRGYVAACVDYTAPRDARHPAQLLDARAAVRWMREHADSLGIDPENIGVVGESSGAYLAIMLGSTGDSLQISAESTAPGTPSAVRAVVAINPPLDWVELDRYGYRESENLLGTRPEADPEGWRAAMPTFIAVEGAPHALHGLPPWEGMVQEWTGSFLAWAMATGPTDVEWSSGAFLGSEALLPEEEEEVERWVTVLTDAVATIEDGLVDQGLSALRDVEAGGLKPGFSVAGDVCGHGTLAGTPGLVAAFCDVAVTAAPSDTEQRLWAHCMRGAAKCLLGEFEDAIADLQVAEESGWVGGEIRALIPQWIQSLKAGTNPITPEILAQLGG